MCFHNDYDWRAEIVDTTTRVSDGKTKCDECRRVIAAGVSFTHIYMQEHEEKVNEEDEEDNYGETFDYDQCDDCKSLLLAIDAVEKAEGCRETQPAFTELRETMFYDNGKYVEKAVEMFPHLTAEYFKLMCGEKE